MVLLLLFSFAAGIITIASPCILSVLTIVLSSSTDKDHSKPLGIITGLIISFSFFTLSISSIVHYTGISPDIFRYIAVIIIMFFGITMIVPSFENFFTRVTSRISHIGSTLEQTSTTKTGFLSGYILGTALGLLWTPCAGPILATITTLAATQQTSFTTIFMMIAYSCGAALPMFIIMYGSKTILNKMHSLIPYTTIIQKIFGILIIISALAIACNVDTKLQTYIARYFPTISFENNPLILEELKQLKKNKDSSMNNHAPDFVAIDSWINSTPLTIQELHGKVVLIDFWTYSCINCIRTLPYLKKWYDSYKKYGFEIIGIHTPEFAFEKNIHNVENAIKKHGITYPVALDNNYATWQAYDNHYWPAHYLVNQQGAIVYHHFGEGNYEETENVIRNLLHLEQHAYAPEISERIPLTPEIYLGYARAQNYQSHMIIKKDQTYEYLYKQPLEKNTVGLEGPWHIKKECITTHGMCTIRIHFIAQHVYLVMDSAQPTEISLLLDGKPVPKESYTKDTQPSGTIKVYEPRMYDILDLQKEGGDHMLSITMPTNVSLYTFTFG